MHGKAEVNWKSESKSQRVDTALQFMERHVGRQNCGNFQYLGKAQKASDHLLEQQATEEFKDEYLRLAKIHKNYYK